ncbi:hypothetical protein T484DRAFT_1783256 [Baffinella frigidus]|nr:hypothetical protein T484DRAFT_1783256 [Cryptophyta sp. CCMP2293]
MRNFGDHLVNLVDKFDQLEQDHRAPILAAKALPASELDGVFDPVALVAAEHRALLLALNADSEAARSADQKADSEAARGGDQALPNPRNPAYLDATRERE